MADNSRNYFPENMDCGSNRFGGIFDGNIKRTELGVNRQWMELKIKLLW